LSANPFLAHAGAGGWLRRDRLGWGLEVDARCRAVGADGVARNSLRVFGPPSAGHFGDPLGVAFIGAQVQRVLPDLL
jgi:uncharacterized NAD(P)/FAD-binding protein YdhS